MSTVVHLPTKTSTACSRSSSGSVRRFARRRTVDRTGQFLSTDTVLGSDELAYTIVEVLLAGESWVTVQFEIKGSDIVNSEYDEGADYFVATLETTGASVTFQPCSVAATSFPQSRDELHEYDVVVLSDIGADTFQITPRVAASETDVDRCAQLAERVRDGGALGMVGGYMSFAGKGGQARYWMTPLADVLPVEIARADRVETPAGVTPVNEGSGRQHPQGVAARPRLQPILGRRRRRGLGHRRRRPVPRRRRPRRGERVRARDRLCAALGTARAPGWEHWPTLWERVLDRVTSE